jgi:[histone H3]-trimethyl-L-lysine4 demethylase
MLLCDGCDSGKCLRDQTKDYCDSSLSGFHIFCLDPPLHHIPRGEWYCHTCIFGTGEDFGFDEGEEHSLSSFQARDRAFRGLWLKKHPPTSMPDPKQDRVTSVDGISYTEADVENEFWRLVHSPEETFEIEYGADVHSTTHGRYENSNHPAFSLTKRCINSAMPTLETHPQNPYAKDSWNLNNMPIAQESLLRYIKSEISGMTVPWTYVGMIFSTFCWHNEDHYTYSINYSEFLRIGWDALSNRRQCTGARRRRGMVFQGLTPRSLKKPCAKRLPTSSRLSQIYSFSW